MPPTATRLVDSDGDGVPDTGLVAPGAGVTITARVQTPPGATLGSTNAASITVRSSLNTAVTKLVDLRTAVPAPFVQVYRDDADGAMSLYLAQPAGPAVRKATANSYYGSNMSVGETPDGNLVYAWYRGRSVGNVYVTEIEHILVNHTGGTARQAARLTDHSAATMPTYNSPAVVAAPNGRVGVLWYRFLYNNDFSQYNCNMYFAVLDAAGNVVVPPTNLTGNSGLGHLQRHQCAQLLFAAHRRHH